MGEIDFGTMIINLSQSVYSVEKLITGFSYLVGLVLIIVALTKFHHYSHTKGETPTLAMAYFIGGLLIFYLPSTVTTLSATTFGAGNVLSYTPYHPMDIYGAMTILIQTAGLIWFIRGCVLIISAHKPGAKDGRKGLAFLVAGVLAVNFHGTMGAINTLMNGIISLSMHA